jgi:hypothetical protein
MSLINGHIDRLRSFEFWREGCQTFAKNVAIVLELALKDWNAEDCVRFLVTLPRNRCELGLETWQKSHCCQCLEKTYEAGTQGKEAVDYFLSYFVDRNYDAQAMLINSLVGIFSGIEAAEKELGSKDGGQNPA